MKKNRDTTITITLRTALLLIPFIFIAVLFLFWVTGQYLTWPVNDEQRTTAVYIAIAGSLLPTGVYLLNFLSQSRASVGVKAFGADITVDFSKNEAFFRPMDLQANIFDPAKHQDLLYSGSEEVIHAISKATNCSVATLDIRDGKAWWLSRLFALSAGAFRFGSPEAIVFLATQENVEKYFIGWAKPQFLFEKIIRDYPDYEKLYVTSKAIFNQLSLYPLYDPHTNMTPALKLPEGVQSYQYAYTQSKEISFLQILLDKLKSFEEPPAKDPIWITISFLIDSFGHCWHKQAIDLNLPAEEQTKRVLDMQTNYVTFTRKGQFAGVMTDQLAIKMILKQLIST